jgi:tight adherence protein C
MESLSVYVGAASVVGSIPLLVWAVASRRERAAPTSSRRIGRRVRQNLVATAGAPITDLRQVVLQKSAHERVVKPGVAALARRARRLTPTGELKALERRIELAGAGYQWPIERVLAAKLVLGGVGLLLGLLRLAADPSLQALFVALLPTAIGYLAPDLLLYHKAQERQQRIQKELADTLDQITISVEAGLAFEPAIARAAWAGRGPLSQELSRALQDIQLGVPRSQALKSLLDRTDSPDLRTFVHAVLQSERYGIPIAQILRVQSSEMREKRRQRAEEQAMKVPVKIVMPLILCILPALFIVLMGPAAIRVANTGFGG